MAAVQIIDLTGVSLSPMENPQEYANQLAKQKAAEFLSPCQVKIRVPTKSSSGGAAKEPLEGGGKIPDEITDPAEQRKWASESAQGAADTWGEPVSFTFRTASGEKIVVDKKPGGGSDPDFQEITSSVQQPPDRPTDIEKTPPSGTATKPPVATDDRSISDNQKQANAQTATANENDDDIDQRSPSLGAGNFKEALGAALGGARQLTGLIGGMESLMMNLPNAVLGKFTSLLPPIFKSFLPTGAVLGVVTKAPVSLNSMMGLVGGAALGAVAGQSLRSVAGGIPLSGYTGRIGAQTIATVAGNQVLSSIAGNVAGNLANQLGTTPGTAAVIANTVGIVSNLALNNRNLGIPVSSQVLGLAANVALNSAGLRTAIPTNIFGLTGAANSINPVASLLGSYVGARVPMMPGNLSLGNIGSLSGIGQNLPPAFAENLIPRSQLGGLLPPNLSSQIPGISPRISAPGSVNNLEMRQRLAPREPNPQDVKPTPGVTPEPSKAPPVTGTDNGRIPYEKMISKYYTLGKLSNATDKFCHNIVPQNGLSVDQIIQNLSYLATNVLDPIVEKIGKPPFITCGFRGPGGTNPGGDHGRGCAADISWGNGNNAKHLDVVQKIRQLGIRCDQVAIEQQGGKSWIHLAAGSAAPGSGPNGIKGAPGDFHLSPATGKFARGFRLV